MTTTFRIGVTRDFLKDDGTLGFGDIGLDLLDEAPKVEWEFLAENTTELRSDQIRGYDGLLVLASIVSAGLPQHLVNPQAAEHPRLQEKLNRYRAIG